MARVKDYLDEQVQKSKDHGTYITMLSVFGDKQEKGEALEEKRPGRFGLRANQIEQYEPLKKELDKLVKFLEKHQDVKKDFEDLFNCKDLPTYASQLDKLQKSLKKHSGILGPNMEKVFNKLSSLFAAPLQRFYMQLDMDKQSGLDSSKTIDSMNSYKDTIFEMMNITYRLKFERQQLLSNKTEVSQGVSSLADVKQAPELKRPTIAQSEAASEAEIRPAGLGSDVDEIMAVEARGQEQPMPAVPVTKEPSEVPAPVPVKKMGERKEEPKSAEVESKPVVPKVPSKYDELIRKRASNFEDELSNEKAKVLHPGPALLHRDGKVESEKGHKHEPKHKPEDKTHQISQP